MAESDLPNQTPPQPEKPEPVTEVNEDNNKTPAGVDEPADPLLNSGAFIDPEQAPDPATPPPEGNAEIDDGAVIAAQPISVVAPGAARKKTTDPEEMKKRPDWLPDDWKMSIKQRTQGASAGLIDRYYFDPTGGQRFRSRKEVLTFIETGSKSKGRSAKKEAGPSETPASKRKRKSSSKTDDGASGSGTQKEKKSRGKRRKSAAADAAAEVKPGDEKPVDAETGELNMDVAAAGNSEGEALVKSDEDAAAAGISDENAEGEADVKTGGY